ncbi:MAG: phosphomannomutase/phosphoglucomutase [Candidatus Palauibacterales bacterium]|nr:phosphomannomutase/phosphoglucomutase [Candidatus Palauibacterales bacterium]MDP2529350.1 phosphomannomutase/phosphoglucomutase [Candidatus Palauibacterales bacterium]MDP2583243.1 phosphomannomutase/phosphoglucomutase [Candidatus Palauibacterales bacterium]
MQVPDWIFREYDIRGVVGEDLTLDVARAVGRAFATRLGAGACVAVGHDNRLSSPDLAAALCDGLERSGVDIRFLGTVPTPVLYFGERVLEVEGAIQITGSHNPPEYNGLKMVVGGEALYGDDIRGLRGRIETDDYSDGNGRTERVEILDRYVEVIAQRAPISPSTPLTLDCGNGTGSVVAPRALEAAGARVDPLYCESDGRFPNHHPDPTVDENVRDLIARVCDRDDGFGVGLDGDADRIGVVTETGRIVRGDHLLLLFALDLLERLPGAEVIFDVKCSKALPELIRAEGGVPVMWKTGHSLIKERMRRTSAPLAGEMSGHICFSDNYFGFDDAIYAAARLAAIVARRGCPVDELAARIPDYPSTPELRLDCPEERKFQVVERVARRFGGEREVFDLDGARIDFGEGWALVRASNTQPVVVVRFEAESAEGLAAIHDAVGRVLEEEGLEVPPLAEGSGADATG